MEAVPPPPVPTPMSCYAVMLGLVTSGVTNEAAASMEFDGKGVAQLVLTVPLMTCLW